VRIWFVDVSAVSVSGKVGGCQRLLGVRGEIRVSHRGDEDDDVAPFGWLNFVLLDHDMCQHMVGQI